MKHYAKISLLFPLISMFLISCSKQPLEPSNGQFILNFQVKEGQSSNLKLGLYFGSEGFRKETSKTITDLKELLNSQEIEQAMIMVLDFTDFETSSQYFESEDYIEYSQTRDNWPGDLQKWGEWEKLLGDYFRIVTNQSLTIGADHIEGTVSGVVGLNYVVIALFENGVRTHWGEAEVITKAGEVTEAFIQLYSI